MLKVPPVDVLGMVAPNVPTLHVLHRLSPQRKNPAPVCVLAVLWALAKWMTFPLPEAKVSPHSSHSLLVLSIDVTDGCSYTVVSLGRRRLTNRSLRFLLRRYAIIGGVGKSCLHLLLECKIGCKSCIFCRKCGIIGLYVVLNIIFSSD